MKDDNPISPRQAVDAYAANRIAGASAGQLVLMTYDYVIGCCRRGDAVNAKRGLVELMGSLNLDYLDVAGPLYRVYEYCSDAVRAGEFDTALGILTELRQAWGEAIPRAETQLRLVTQGDLEA